MGSLEPEFPLQIQIRIIHTEASTVKIYSDICLWELSVRQKTVRFSGHTMSADKDPSIFSRNAEALSHILVLFTASEDSPCLL